MAQIPASSWLNTFLRETAHVASPELFRLWAGISAISAVAQRRLWTVVRGEKLFLNMYMLLVGPPGGGKTRAIRLASKMVHKASKVRLFPQKNTKESAIESVCKSLSTFEFDGNLRTQCAISGFFDEIMNFIPPRDFELMGFLTDWYDCPSKWIYATRMRGEEVAENVYCTFVGGITPKNIVVVLGPNAFGMGFTSRLNIIFCEDKIDSDPFDVIEEKPYTELIERLSAIAALSGPIRLTDGAKHEVRKWLATDMAPLPSDSRFSEYNPRRWLHWIKLAMIVALAEGSTVVETSHVGLAKEILLEAEAVMPLALEHLGTNPMADAVNQLHRWALVQFLANGRKPIPESQIIRRLMADVPQQYHATTLEYMLNSRMFTALGTAPSRTFTPQKVDR